jgi:hypothetical protein
MPKPFQQLDDGIPRRDVAKVMKVSLATLQRYITGMETGR